MSDWTKKQIINEMEKKYDNKTLFNYPTFAKNKLPKCIKIKAAIPKFNNREEVIEWIDTNMNEEQIAYVGF